MTPLWKDYPVEPEDHDEPYRSNLSDQITGGVILLVVILALIGGATVIKGSVS